MAGVRSRALRWRQLGGPARRARPGSDRIHGARRHGPATMTQPTFASVAVLIDRLGELHGRTRETPLFNPVFQLGLDISRALEAGELTLDGIAALVAELGCLSLQSRADRKSTRLNSSH